MPHRTTLPVWTQPTSGPAGPHDVKEILAGNELAKAWVRLLELAIDARRLDIQKLEAWREAREIAKVIVRPGGAVRDFLYGVSMDTHMTLQSTDALVRALDGYIGKLLDTGKTHPPSGRMGPTGGPDDPEETGGGDG